VPPFYFPQGKPISQDTIRAHNEAIEKVFGKGAGPGKSIGKDEFEQVATEIFKIPKIFKDMLFERIEQKQGATGLPQVAGKPTVNK